MLLVIIPQVGVGVGVGDNPGVTVGVGVGVFVGVALGDNPGVTVVVGVGVGDNPGVGVGVGVIGCNESLHMSIAVPLEPPGPTTVNVVNGDESLIVKIPFPFEPIHHPRHIGDVFDAVIMLPLIIAQQYWQDEITGTPLPIFVVNVNDSALVEVP